MWRALFVLSGLIAIAAALWFASRQPPITSEAASGFLAECLQSRAERCSIKDDANWEDLSKRTFRLSQKADPQLAVANYEFVSSDGQYCAFIQFGKDDMSDVRTAEFFRCANRNRVTLGVG